MKYRALRSSQLGFALTYLLFIGVWLVTPAGAAQVSSSAGISELRERLLCSTALSPEPFDLSEDLLDLNSYFAMQPEDRAVRVDLDGNFIYIQPLSDLIQPVAAMLHNVHPQLVASRASEEWRVRKSDLLFSINFGLMRGRLPEHELSVEELDFLSVEQLLVDPVQRIVDPLYRAYGSQGPERSELLSTIKTQDQTESARYLRVVLSRFVKPMAYAQILVSQHPGENLHAVDFWGEGVEKFIDRQPGEVLGEFGRLKIIHPNTYEFDHHRSLVDPLADQSALKTNRIISHLLFQKSLSWINADARLDKLLIQINSGVERVLKLYDIPIELGRREELKSEWSNGEEVKEILYVFNREQLLKAEDIMMKKVIFHWLRAAAAQPLFQNAPGGMLHFFFLPNELSVLRRIGLYQHLNPGMELPRLPFGSGISSVFQSTKSRRLSNFLVIDAVRFIKFSNYSLICYCMFVFVVRRAATDGGPMKRLLFLVAASFVTLANAQSLEFRAVQYGGRDGLDACRGTGIATATTTMFVPTRAGNWRHESLEVNQSVFFCDEQGEYTGVVVAEPEKDCGVAGAVKKRKPYKGPCRSGWVKTSLLELLAG